MGEDVKLTVKNLLQAGIDSSAVVDNKGDAVKWIVTYAYAIDTMAKDYFKDKNTPVVVTVGKLRTVPWRQAGNNIIQYKEFLDIHIWTIDTDTITGEKLKWIMEQQVRAVFSANKLEQVHEENDDEDLESQILYNTKYIIVYDSFGAGLFPGQPPNSMQEWGGVAEGYTGHEHNIGGVGEGFTGLHSNPGNIAEAYTGKQSEPGAIAKGLGGKASAVGGICEESV